MFSASEGDIAPASKGVEAIGLLTMTRPGVVGGLSLGFFVLPVIGVDEVVDNHCLFAATLILVR